MSGRLAEALELPVAAAFMRAGFAWQTVRSLCGPASVWNVLASLGTSVSRRELLDGTGIRTLFGFRLGGTTLDQLADVVRLKSGHRETVLRDLSLDELRAHLGRANDLGRRYIVNFHRRPLFAWGGGHHSPIGGYLADEDLVLVLDTNRRVGPWLVPAEKLHAAVATVDPSSGRGRGLLLVE